MRVPVFVRARTGLYVVSLWLCALVHRWSCVCGQRFGGAGLAVARVSAVPLPIRRAGPDLGSFFTVECNEGSVREIRQHYKGI